MHEGLTTSNYSNASGKLFGFLNYLFEADSRVLAFIPAVFHIAPNAAYITACQPDKIRGLSLMKSFTLYRIKGFHNGKRFNLVR
jgi:hypothetical protein